MSDILNNLKDEYKQKKNEATSKEEKQQIKHDYKEIKELIKGADKLIQKHDQELKKFDKVWDKLDKEYQKLGETSTFEEVKEELNDNQQQFEEQKKHGDEVIKKADEMIKQIDEKLAELEKKESLEKTKQDYNNLENEVLARINDEEYQTIEEAKEQANNIIRNENDLASVWENGKNNMKIIKETRELISKGENGLTTKIKGLEVCFWGETLEEVSDEMIAFALDIVNAYQSDKEKYDEEALKEVKNYLNEDEEVDDSTILNQLGIPIIDVTSKLAACLMYGGVEEIGTHMPEVRLNRNLEVEEVALNG